MKIQIAVLMILLTGCGGEGEDIPDIYDAGTQSPRFATIPSADAGTCDAGYTLDAFQTTNGGRLIVMCNLPSHSTNNP